MNAGSRTCLIGRGASSRIVRVRIRKIVFACREFSGAATSHPASRLVDHVDRFLGNRVEGRHRL